MTSETTTAPLTLFVLIKALPSFLALSHADRRTIADTVAASLPEGLRVRQFDCEAFSAMCSDIWVLEDTNPMEANETFEQLRDSPIFAKPYFELVAILPAIENGWRHFEAAHGLAA